jgi:hypothetical protein
MSLSFRVTGGEHEPHAAVPMLVFELEIDGLQEFHHIALTAQIRIEAQRREHSANEAANLEELFGKVERWGDTLRPLLWGHASVLLTQLDANGRTRLPVPCTYDFEVASVKYLHSLEDGDIPLVFLFTGTVFERAETGLRIQRIAWDREAGFRLPVRSWRRMMDHHYPGGGWLRLQKETLDALLRFKASRALPTWDGVVEALLAREGL